MIKGRFYSLDYASALFVKSVSIKIQFFLKKGIANFKSIVYTSRCCDMIAMKREVAVDKAVFPWSECQVRKLTTSHCTSSKNHHRDGRVFKIMGNTRRCVQSPLVVLLESTNRRRLFLWQIR